MRKIFFVLFVAILFLACEQPESVGDVVGINEDPWTIEKPEVNVKKFYVKNSNWETVDKGDLLSNRSVQDIPVSIKVFVEEYNNTHNDDQLTILTEDVPVSEAPSCNVYIVKKNSHEIIREFLGFSRVLLAQRRDDFNVDARQYGDAEVYVDKIPPAYVPPVDNRPDYVKYAIYLVNADGSIFYQENAIEKKPAYWKKSDKEWFNERVSQFRLDLQSGNFSGCRLVYGEEYIAPSI